MASLWEYKHDVDAALRLHDADGRRRRPVAVVCRPRFGGRRVIEVYSHRDEMWLQGIGFRPYNYGGPVFGWIDYTETGEVDKVAKAIEFFDTLSEAEQSVFMTRTTQKKEGADSAAPSLSLDEAEPAPPTPVPEWLMGYERSNLRRLLARITAKSTDVRWSKVALAERIMSVKPTITHEECAKMLVE